MQRVSSVVEKNCEAKLVLHVVPNPLDEELKADEVVVRVEAAPINPSDLGVMRPPGTDDKAMQTLKALDSNKGLSYKIDSKFSKYLAARFEKMVPVGNEGAGVVVKAGSSPEAQSLLNKVVSTNGGMYSQYRKVKVSTCMVHKAGTTPEQAASSFVNPMTVVGFLETMKMENHNAIIHTAAASQLGQMLVKYCQKLNVDLINVVRKESQEKMLRDLGAKYVVRSDKESFVSDLAALVAETKATLAFDAIGGGHMASNLLTAMEMGARKFAPFDPASPYGTSIYKQVYIYGGLDRSPMIMSQNAGFCWGVGAWLMPNFLAKIPPKKVGELRQEVAENITSIFSSTYYKKITLQEMVNPVNFAEYSKQETGKKFLVTPIAPANKL